jgi:tRNA-Thr(GGU) m(6)t(6)A37 methyltransferase TsaA
MSERPKETRCKRVGTAYAGSNPAPPIRPSGRHNADVAQLVEHLHGKEGVRGSSPLVGFPPEYRLTAIEEPHAIPQPRANVPGDGLEMRPIGKVESPLTDRAMAPRQGHEGAPDAWLVFERDVLDALEGVRPGDRIIVLTWLDRAQRDVLQVHPRDDIARPKEGVFNTRSADRPNPIGLHEVEVVSLAAARVHVRPLEALNGTPILDVKPVLTRPTRGAPG